MIAAALCLAALVGVLAACGIAWMLTHGGRASDDYNKETPPAGWIAHPAAWPIPATDACPCAACQDRIRPRRRATIRPESLWGA